jgi:prepilin-type N-terminal cleavage/methylation domain-containing protein
MSRSGGIVRRLGFTLVELLVTVSIVAILIGILVPHLANVRIRAYETKSIVNLHTIAQHISLYNQIYSEYYPFLLPNQSVVVSPLEDTYAITYLSFEQVWDLSHYWHALMHSVAPWRESYHVWISPGSPRDLRNPWDIEGPRSGLPSYVLMPAFFAKAGVWTPGTPASSALIGPVRVADVAFPSNKVMMIDLELAYRRTKVEVPRGMLFADGHASLHFPSSAKPPGVNVFTGSSQRLFDTLDGVRGVDY